MSSGDASVIYMLNLSSLEKVWSVKLDHTVVGAEVFSEGGRYYLVIARECREYGSYEVDIVIVDGDSHKVIPVMMGKGKVIGVGRLGDFAVVGIRSGGTDLYVVSRAGYIVKRLHIGDYGLELVTDRQGRYAALTGLPKGMYKVFLTLAGSLEFKECFRSENLHSLALAGGEGFTVLLVADGDGLHVLNCSEGSCKEVVSGKVWSNDEIVKSVVSLSPDKYVVATDRALYAVVLVNSSLRKVSAYGIANLGGAFFIPPDNLLAYTSVGVLDLFKVVAPCRLRITTQYPVNVTIKSQAGDVGKVVTPTSSAVLYLKPEKYELIVKPVTSGLYGVIGPTTNAELRTYVVAESGGSKEITIRLSDLIRLISIRNEWPVPIYLVLKWDNGEVEFTLPNHTARNLLVFPGNYTVSFKPLARFKIFAGPLRYFSRDVTITQNTTLVLKPAEYLSCIEVVITQGIPANVTISWSGGELKLGSVENNITLYAVPGIKYCVTASLSQTAPLLTELRVREYVSISSPNEVKIVTIDFLKYGGILRIASDCNALVSIIPRNTSLPTSEIVIKGEESKFLLVPSGEYKVIVSPASSYVKDILGDVSKLSSSYVCTVAPRDECDINYSLREHLGTIVLTSRSLSGEVSICWEGGECREFRLSPNKSLTFKAVTGRYVVTASTLVYEVPYLGDQKRITERYEILVKAMSSTLVETPQPAVLKVVSSSVYVTHVKVRDEVSSSEITVDPNSIIYLQPGVRRLLITPTLRDFILGNATKVSEEVTMHAVGGSTYEYIIDVNVSKLVPDLSNCVVNVTWDGGSAKAVFEGGKVVKLTKCVSGACKVLPLNDTSLLLLHGKYLVTTSPRVSPIIGGKEHVVVVRNLTVSSTETYYVHVTRLATLKLIPNVPAEAIDYLTVKVSWEGGEYVAKVREAMSLTAAPNVEYRVTVEPVLKADVVGDPSVLRLVTYIQPIGEGNITTLRYGLEMSKVVVKGSGEVIIRYGMLSRNYHVEGVLSLNLVWRNESMVKIVLKPNIPPNFVGSPESVTREVLLTSKNLSIESVVLKIPELGWLLIKGDSEVLIKFGQQVYRYVIRGYLKLAATPGEYFVEIHPDLSSFRPLVGDASSTYYTLKVSVAEGKTAVISVDPKRVLSRIRFLCFKGSTLLIKWASGEVKQVCSEDEVHTYLIRGNYIVKALLPDNISLVPGTSITRVLVVKGGEDLLEDLRPAVIVLKSVSGSYSVKVMSGEGLYLRTINLSNGAMLKYLVRPNVTYLLRVSLAELPKDCIGGLGKGWKVLNISSICKYLSAGSECVIRLSSQDFVSILSVRPNVNGIVQIVRGDKELVSKPCRAGEYLRFCLVAEDVVVRLIPSYDNLVGDIRALTATTHLRLEPGRDYLVELKAIKPCTIILKDVAGDVELEYNGYTKRLGAVIAKSLKVKVVPGTRYIIKVHPYSNYLEDLTLTARLNSSVCSTVIDAVKYKEYTAMHGELRTYVLVVITTLVATLLSALYTLRHAS